MAYNWRKVSKSSLQANSPEAEARPLFRQLPETTAAGFPQDFFWCQRSLRRYAVLVSALTIAALPVCLLQNDFLRGCGCCWLIWMLKLSHGIAVRARSEAPVLTIDSFGVRDVRLASAPFHWDDIAAFESTRLDRTQVIECYLKRSRRPEASATLSVRLGHWLQRRSEYPALTFNLFLLDASAFDIANAIATFRPGALPRAMLDDAIQMKRPNHTASRHNRPGRRYDAE